MFTASSLQEIVSAPLRDLAADACRIRDVAFGDHITFSPKVFVPLTMLCRDRCGYCTFAKPPARLDAPFLSPEEVLATARAGAAAGCHELLLTLGEAPGERYPEAAEWLAAHGYASTVEYVAATARMIVEETSLLPHANAGALPQDEIALLREWCPSQGMMIETLAPRLGEPGGPHHASPDKTPARRLEALEAAGRARVPFTTGILVGIGETRDERIQALLAIAESHERHGHVQEVIVQNFLPKAGTAMHRHTPCDPDEYLWTVAAARIVLPPPIHLQAPPNLSDDLGALLAAGIDDWGGVSPVTADHVNPERPWPALDHLRDATRSAGKVLVPRLTAHPRYVRDDATWIHPGLRFAVMQVSDSEGLARDDTWAPGCDDPPPVLVSEVRPDSPRRTARSGDAVGRVLDGVAAGEEIGIEEMVTLLGARGTEVARVARTADALRREIVGDDVTFVRNRNINYTNICTYKCRFCAFSKGPLSLNLRGRPYLLDLEEIQRRVIEAVDCGATEVCLQGGIHPDFDGSFYADVVRAVREASTGIHIHAFSALEVAEGARRLEMPLDGYLTMLKAAGLSTLPGTAAEILDDDVRSVLCPDKISTDEWLEVHRTAHSVGLRSNVTIMNGHIERPVHIARHIVRTRTLQQETGGFTEFVPLPFVHMASPIYLQRRARPGPTWRETLLLHAVGRIAYRDAIPNVQVSWPKCGLVGAAQILQAGANDLGGTLMDENISRAAGASHGVEHDDADFRSVVEPLGRPLVQRTTLYEPTHTTGKRLHALDDAGPADTRGSEQGAVPVTLGSHTDTT